MADNLPRPISKMVVKDLKVELQKRGLDTKGLKADLVKRLEAALGEGVDSGTAKSEDNGKETPTKENEQVSVEVEVVEEAKSKRGNKRKSNGGRGSPKSSPKAAKKEEGSKLSIEETTEQFSEAKEDSKVAVVAIPTEDHKNETAGESKESKLEQPSKEVSKPEESKKKAAIQPPVSAAKREAASSTSSSENKDSNVSVVATEPKKPLHKEEKKETESKSSSNEDKKEASSSRRQRKWGTSDNSAESISTETIQDILTTAASTETPQKRKREDGNNSGSKETKTPPSRQRQEPIKTPQKEIEPEIREVPPSLKPTSNVLLITNFVRPFTTAAVQELLNETGKVQAWEMDSIKSRCYVIYETVEEAVATRNALHNLGWPPTNKTKLQVDFSTEVDAKKSVAGVSNAEKKRDKSPPPQEKVLTLDDIFRKTVAKPSIYYLPLSADQIEAKKRAAEEERKSKSKDEPKEVQKQT